MRCGAVRYQVRGNAVWKAGCTCNTCVKIHAAPYVVWAGFDLSDFQMIQGKLKEYRSTQHVLRTFCAACGSTLTYSKDASDIPALEAAARLIYIAVASLDRPELFPPDEIVHGQEKIDWMLFGGDVPVRQFISESAGDLQFGGIDPELANVLAKRHFGTSK